MAEILTLIEKTAFLKSIPMLSTIPTESLADVAGRAQEMHCDPGQVIYNEGDPNRGAFLVVSGLLKMRKGKASVRIVKPGMSIGELWLAEGEPHQYTLVAIDHSHVLHIRREDVEDAILEYPEFGLAMVRMLSHRAHELITRVLDLEQVVARMHHTMTQAGIDPPDARPPGVTEDAIPRPGKEAENPW